MSPKLILILVIVLVIIFGGMALTMKRAADKRRDRTALVIPAEAGIPFHSIKRCFIA
jgi:hypothetical protein